jgi:hypothetical protein
MESPFQKRQSALLFFFPKSENPIKAMICLAKSGRGHTQWAGAVGF